MTAAPTKPSVDAILDRSEQLAVLPHVVHKVLEITASEETLASNLAQTIAIDPGFSMRLLKVANSAAFGMPRKVTSTQQAIMFLGFKAIRSIALTVGVYEVFIGKSDRESMRRRSWWRQSLDTAVCSRQLAKSGVKVSLDDAYTCGLLHLIGKVLLDRYGSKDYGAVDLLVSKGYSDQISEGYVYGCDHCEVAAGAAERWNLPPSLKGGLRYLTVPEPSDPTGTLRACIIVASKMALMAKGGIDPESVGCPEWALERLQMPGVSMSSLAALGRQAISEAELRI